MLVIVAIGSTEAKRGGSRARFSPQSTWIQAVASKTWVLIQNAGSLLFAAPGRSKGGIKETVFSSLKQVGLFAGLRALFSLWKRR